VSRTEVPTNELVTSFSSKSELALNDSTSGRAVSFMGYDAPVSAIDVSNSNTPLAPDPTNPVPGIDYRAAAVLHDNGRFDFTLTNAYSGNNGRAAILNDGRARRCGRPTSARRSAASRSPPTPATTTSDSDR
jgi:hypothetical protein